MQVWYTYIIECSDKTFYVGTTNNIEERITKHNTGKGAKYTKGRAPVKVLYTRSFDSRSEACKHEYELKQYSRKEKLDLIKEYKLLYLTSNIENR
ncbi:MAG: GIY-YIG nuclease family protein [Bacteroidia bacterium]